MSRLFSRQVEEFKKSYPELNKKIEESLELSANASAPIPPATVWRKTRN
jgi:hypothetical protein